MLAFGRTVKFQKNNKNILYSFSPTIGPARRFSNETALVSTEKTLPREIFPCQPKSGKDAVIDFNPLYPMMV